MNKYYLEIQNLERLSQTPAEKQERGRKFEVLINKIFQEEGVLIRGSYHTSDNRAEQIDGAIKVGDKIMLLEVKWVESNLAASDLFSFIGKVENKLTGTLGVFISKEKLSDNFISAINKGRRPSVIVIHKPDLDLYFQTSDIRLSDFIIYATQQLSIDSINHISFESYLNTKPSFGGSEDQKKVIKEIHEMIFSNEDQSIQIEIFCEKHTELKDKIFIYYIKNHDKLLWGRVLKGDYRVTLDNWTIFLETYFSTAKNKNILLESFLEAYFQKSEKRGWFSDRFLREVGEAYKEVNEQFRLEFEKKLILGFNKILDNYNDENYYTDLIQFLFDSLYPETKMALIGIYITIYLSDRRDKFKQKSFAKQLLNSENDLIKPAIKKWITTRYNEFESMNLKLDDEFKIDSKKRIVIDTLDLAKIYNIHSPDAWGEKIGTWISES